MFERYIITSLRAVSEAPRGLFMSISKVTRLLRYARKDESGASLMRLLFTAQSKEIT